MFPVSACNCLWAIYLCQVLSREWRCSWSSANRRCFNSIWVINNLIAYLSAVLYYRLDSIYLLMIIRISVLHHVSIIKSDYYSLAIVMVRQWRSYMCCMFTIFFCSEMVRLFHGMFHILLLFTQNRTPVTSMQHHYIFARDAIDIWDLSTVFPSLYFSLACVFGNVVATYSVSLLWWILG